MVIAPTNLFGIGCAFCALIAAQSEKSVPGTFVAETRENVEVAGVLECELRRDVRAMVRSERKLRCEFRPERGLPDRMTRYRGSIRDLEAGVPSADGDALAWTVLFLKSDGASGSGGDAQIAGAYSRSCASVIEGYGLKEDTLVGGANRDVALEPRLIDTTAPSRNVAPAVIAFEISK